jgi:formylglycine-generating enzyme required for sulfatase activity
MAILVTCGACGARFRAKEKYRGRSAECPKCKAALTLDGEAVADFDVFVSYSSRDAHAANAVVASLEAKRIRCWIAPRDIVAGAEWSASIIDAIHNSRVMVLVFSANSNASKQVFREVERAVSRGLPIVPLRLDDVALSKNMEYFISASHWLDAKHGPTAEHLERLRKAIEALLVLRADEVLPGEAGDTPPAVAPLSRMSPRTWSMVAAGALVLILLGVLIATIRPRKKVSSTQPVPTPIPSSVPSTRDASARPGPAIANGIGMQFAYIPAGRFMMGAREGDYHADRDERPRHAVVISKPFHMAVFELTIGQYKAVSGELPDATALRAPHKGGLVLTADNIPVSGLTFEQAEAFCDALGALPGEVAAHRMYRLPTEAEWEYACRAGTDNIYIGRDTLTHDEANFSPPEPNNGNNKPDHPMRWMEVGSYPPNPWGLYDMLGNVREWCSDYRAPYRPEEQTDPTGPRTGRVHVIRGGGVVDGPARCRVSERCRVDEKAWKDNRVRAGVRVVCIVNGSAAK